MRNGLIVAGVLGAGTAAVFALAAVAATAFPQGGTVTSMWNGAWNGGIVIAKPMPVPMPAVPAPGVIVVDDSTNAGGSGTIVVTPPDAGGGFEVTPSDAPPAK